MALAARGGLPGPAVVAIGMFDGLHEGHRRLLAELKAWAREAGAAPRVVTFDRHPQEVLTGSGPVVISSLEHRLVLLEREGIADTLVLSFDRAVSAESADDFVRRVVVRALGGRMLLLGFDTAIGHKRRGNFEYLGGRASALGIQVRQARIERINGERVSSTLVRDALAVGDLARLEQLLGRPFALFGRVMEGDGRGRTLGFPTANVDTMGTGLPPLGVYFAHIVFLDRPGVAPWTAVVNVGKRPTFKDPTVACTLVEAHLLDWNGSLYGERVEVMLRKRARGELKFESVDALVEQIRLDVARARDFFRQDP